MQEKNFENFSEKFNIDASELLEYLKKDIKKAEEEILDQIPTLSEDVDKSLSHIEVRQFGRWIWINIFTNLRNKHKNKSTNDIPKGHGVDWVGKLDNLPIKINSKYQLDKWAVYIATKITHNLYEEGCWVNSLDEAGIAKVIKTGKNIIGTSEIPDNDFEEEDIDLNLL